MTDVVVSSNMGNVLATVDTTNNITNTQIEVLVVTDYNSSVVTLTTTGSILVESLQTETLLTGIVGPAGTSGINEEDIVYSKRVDFVTENSLYKAEAAVGSSESSAVWRIRYIVIGLDGDVSETWASGNANFDKVWADRSALIYS